MVLLVWIALWSSGFSFVWVFTLAVCCGGFDFVDVGCLLCGFLLVLCMFRCFLVIWVCGTCSGVVHVVSLCSRMVGLVCCFTVVCGVVLRVCGLLWLGWLACWFAVVLVLCVWCFVYPRRVVVV